MSQPIFHNNKHLTFQAVLSSMMYPYNTSLPEQFVVNTSHLRHFPMLSSKSRLSKKQQCNENEQDRQFQGGCYFIHWGRCNRQTQTHAAPPSLDHYMLVFMFHHFLIGNSIRGYLVPVIPEDSSQGTVVEGFQFFSFFLQHRQTLTHAAPPSLDHDMLVFMFHHFLIGNSIRGYLVPVIPEDSSQGTVVEGFQFFQFFSVAFQHSQPHRSALRGPAMYIWYFTLMSISLQSKKCFAILNSCFNLSIY